MRVLFITARSDIGGGPKHVYDMAREFKKRRDVEVYLASPLDLPFGEKYLQLANKFFSLPTRKFTITSFLKLLIFCKSNEIQIIHSHGRGAGIYSRLLSLFGFNVIHTFHGVHLENTLIGKIKSFSDKFLKYLTDTFICVSHDEFKSANRANFCLKEKTQVILNGVNVEEIQREYQLLKTEACKKEFKINTPKKVWGTLGRLTFQKGFDLLKEMEIPEDVQLVIAGSGEEDAFLKQILTHKDIIFVGPTNNPIHFLKTLDGYFSCSRWEGMPLSVLEAMSCNLPCILSKVTGHIDLENGAHLYDLLDKNGLKKNIELKKFKNSMEYVRKNHTTEKMVEDTYNLYRHLS